MLLQPLGGGQSLWMGKSSARHGIRGGAFLECQAHQEGAAPNQLGNIFY